TTVTPDSAEAWLNLAALQGAQGNTTEGNANLAKAFALSDARTATNAKAPDLRKMFGTDKRFEAIRAVLKTR
ncbi:MAG: hypothetical protein WCP53_01285, partial [Verrucomicrobiota bacterium]